MRISELFYRLGSFLSYPIFRKMYGVIQKINQLIHSGFHGAKFANVGKSFRLTPPIKFINGHKYISIGNNVYFHPGLRMEAICVSTPPRIIIHDNVSVGYNCQINSCQMIEIKDGCLLGSNVFITDHYHGNGTLQESAILPSKRILYSKGPVIIEENVWIGQNVSIMPNVTIGKGCIIGANSVVTHSFPPNFVVAGVPAKIVRSLS